MKGSRFRVLAGVAVLLTALGLTLHNLWQDRLAGAQAQQTLLQLQTPTMPTTPPPPLSSAPIETLPTPAETTPPPTEEPTTMLDGETFIGILSIPKLKLQLPIRADCSPQGLKKSPCRYRGSLISGDLVLAGHNYKSHFGPIRRLKPGDAVVFTDAWGQIHHFEVCLVETLPGTATAEMRVGDWALTLFTCTLDSRSRITVRCRTSVAAPQ